jgi:hypothetical protein
VHYDPNVALVLATDASPYGLGVVLSHVMPDGSERPIAFGSRTLTKSEANYSQIDKEATAIVWGLKKYFRYCCGRKFTLLTDHKALTSIFHPHKHLPALSATRNTCPDSTTKSNIVEQMTIQRQIFFQDFR